MRVDLLEFEQKTVVPILRLDHDKFGIRDTGRDFALLREHEKAIRLNTNDKSSWGELREHCFLRATPSCDVVGIKLASDVDIAISIETSYKLVSLVTEV